MHAEMVLGELLKHRRVLITSLDTKSEEVKERINEELEKTEQIIDEIKETYTELKNIITTNHKQ